MALQSSLGDLPVITSNAARSNMPTRALVAITEMTPGSMPGHVACSAQQLLLQTPAMCPDQQLPEISSLKSAHETFLSGCVHGSPISQKSAQGVACLRAGGDKHRARHKHGKGPQAALRPGHQVLSWLRASKAQLSIMLRRTVKVPRQMLHRPKSRQMLCTA